MAPIWYDGECQECWQVQRDRTWADMSYGCRNCGGVVIPCWALPDYSHERPQSFNRSPWWAEKDISGLYAPEDVACVRVETPRPQPDSTETGLAGRLSRVLGYETYTTRHGGTGVRRRSRR